jgi:uncharacterized protein (DUF2235 family)
MKNIAIFCDGTWQSIDQPDPTNVTRLLCAVSARREADGAAQIVYYDDGVGVGEGVLNGLVSVIGGGLGKGLEAKIADAYRFLCLNFQPGDRIFIFGFSRGAYTARSLAGLLRKCWILRREEIRHIGRAIDLYRARDIGVDAPEVHAFRQAHCQHADTYTGQRGADAETTGAMLQGDAANWASVQYVGVWDTVGSLGIPRSFPFAPQVNSKYLFHDLRLSRFVLSARHAVAVDERRSTFEPTLWENIADLNANAESGHLPFDERPYQQSWFPGAHGGVGGGQRDGGLCFDALLWIADGAMRAGLDLEPSLVEAHRHEANALADFVVSRSSLVNRLIALVGMKDRGGPDEFVAVSPAARHRWQCRDDYRPPPLGRFTDQLSGSPGPTSGPAHPGPTTAAHAGPHPPDRSDRPA